MQTLTAEHPDSMHKMNARIVVGQLEEHCQASNRRGLKYEVCSTGGDVCALLQGAQKQDRVNILHDLHCYDT